MRTQTSFLSVIVASWGLLASLCPADAQDTAFIYQGRLHEGDSFASGAYDFDFRVFDGAHAGAEVGVAWITNAVPVTEGQFNVLLDFGPGVFTGEPRWLQISVRPSGSAEAFTQLRPRQTLAATPYAVTASHLSGTLAASQITGPLLADQLAGAYSNVVSFVHSSNSFQGTFSGDGSGLTNLNWSATPTQAAFAKILWVAPWGDDQRAERGRLERPWGTWSNAVANAGNGDVVRILPGRYTNTHRSDLYGLGEANVLIERKTNFVIEGIGLPTLYNPTTAVLMAVLKCSNVVVRGLSLESENYNNWSVQPLPGGVFGHLVYADVEWLTVEDCTFSKGTDHGILEPANLPATFPSTNNIIIRHNRFSSFGFWGGGFGANWWDGAAIVCGAAHVHGNDIQNVGRGIEVFPILGLKVPHAVIRNNRIWNTVDYGIGLVEASSLSVVQDNVIFNDPDFTYQGSNALPTGAGIEVAGASDCVISGNYIRHKPHGVFLFLAGAVPHRNRVLHNTVMDCQTGIYISAGEGAILASNNIIAGNSLANLEQCGIAVYRGADTVIRDNIITDPSTRGGQYGIRIFGASVNTTVIGNTITDTGPGDAVAGLAFHDGGTNGAIAAYNRFVGVPAAIEGTAEIEDGVKTQNGSLVLPAKAGLSWPGVALTADAAQGGAWNVTNLLIGERGTWGVTLSARTPGQLELWDAAGPGTGSLARVVVGDLEASRVNAAQVRASALLLPGTHAASNLVWTCTDPLTGAGEWRPPAVGPTDPPASLAHLTLHHWTNDGQVTWRTNALHTDPGGRVFVSFTNQTVQWLTFTNATITLATTNREVAAHRTIELWLSPTMTATQRTIVFPPNWRRFRGSEINALPSNKLAVVRLRLLASDGDESTVAAWWEREQ